MKRLFVFTTRQTEVERYFINNRRNLVPEEMRRSYDTISVARCLAAGDLDAFFRTNVLDRIDEYQNIFLFYEGDLESQLDAYAFSLIRVEYEFREPRAFLNALSARIAAAIRRAELFIEKMQDHTSLQTLLLPRRNFLCSEIKDIWEFFSIADSDRSAREKLEQLVSALVKARRRPKRFRKSGNKKFFIDERAWHFEYGMERHGAPELGEPNHKIGCALASAFRFSTRYDNTRHYNLTLSKGNFTGAVNDCHDVEITVRGASHVNIWPSDYFVPKFR